MNFWVQTYYQKTNAPHPVSLMGVVLMLLVILGSLGHSATSIAGTTVALRESYAGNLSFQLTGGSFRTQSNNGNHCVIDTQSSNPLTGIPATATVIKAYLYWTGSSYNGAIDNQVTLNGTDYSADRTYTESKETRHFYNGIKDITSYVNTMKNIDYTVSNLDIENTGDHCSRATVLGGWAILAIYEDDAEDFRVLNLYEGFEFFQNRSFDLIPNNFKLPANPTGKHAHITWEGDDTLGGNTEYLEFQGVRLWDTTNPETNQFNSRSNVLGFGAENWTYGVDIDSYSISDLLTEGLEEVTTTYSAAQDLVILNVEVVSVSNIPVADLSVTTSTPTSWQANSTVTKKFTVSNNGPNDVPTKGVSFIATLDPGLTLDSLPSDPDWNCTQSVNTLTCVYQNNLRSGWSDYLDITFNVGDVPSPTPNVTMSVSVNHDDARYDIFDNQVTNNSFVMTVPVSTVAVVDLSASSKVPTLNSDVLLAGDTLEYTITIDDASDLAVTGITVTDELPSNITGYNIKETAGGSWSITDNTLTFSNISLAAGTGANSTKQIKFEVTIDENAQDGASLQNLATITHNATEWIVDTGDITVSVDPDLSPSLLEISDLNSGLLYAGEILEMVITLDDLVDTDISNLNLAIDLPTSIISYEITSTHNGTDTNGASIGIEGLSFNAATTSEIIIELTIDPSTPFGTAISLEMDLTLGNKIWNMQSNEVELVDPDLSPSLIEISDQNSDLLYAGEILEMVITLDDLVDTDINNLNLAIDLPTSIISYEITSTHNGTDTNGAGIGIEGLSFNAATTSEIIIELTIDPSTPFGTAISLEMDLTLGNKIWNMQSNEVELVDPDLSPSLLEISDQNSGFLYAGEILEMVITLDDLVDTDITNLNLAIDLPTSIISYEITPTHNGTDTAGASIGITGLSFNAATNSEIVIELTIDPNIALGSLISFDMELTLANKAWNIQSNEVEIVEAPTAASGNKQLYLSSTPSSNLTMSRIQPSTGIVTLENGATATSWMLTPALNAALTFSLDDISVELVLNGNRKNGKDTTTAITITLGTQSGIPIASVTKEVAIKKLLNEADIYLFNLTKDPALDDPNITIDKDEQFVLTVSSDTGDTKNNRQITLSTYYQDTTDAALGYSALIINASTVISVDSIEVWDKVFNAAADYSDDSGAQLITSSQPDTTLSIRASISDPFGAFDISAATITLTKPGSTLNYFAGDNTMEQIDDPTNDETTNSKLFEKTIKLEEVEITGDWIIRITGLEGIEGQVDHFEDYSFKVTPFLPNITLTKNIAVISDPINGSSKEDPAAKPKAIPGAELLYTIYVTNSGRGKSDDGSIIIQDEIPENTELYINKVTCEGTDQGPVCFKDGTPPNDSDIEFDIATDLTFAEDDGNFNYTPVDSGEGYDPAIRYIRMTPTKQLKSAPKDASTQPEFNFYYQVRLK